MKNMVKYLKYYCKSRQNIRQ